MRGKPHHLPDGRAMAYQYYAPAGRLYNKPIGHQGGSQWRSGSMNLFMYGRAVEHTCKGKTLIALDGVDVTRGDGKIEYNVKSYEQALAIVKRWADTNAAAFWHSSSSRMILKPKNNGARWTGKGIGGEGIGTLFMWADKPLLPGGGFVGVWEPTRVDEWVSCPVQLHDRNKYQMTIKNNGDWIGGRAGSFIARDNFHGRILNAMGGGPVCSGGGSDNTRVSEIRFRNFRGLGPVEPRVRRGTSYA